MRFWIDIANTPHVTLFRPVAHRLEEMGHEIVVTVFDRGLTAPVAQTVWPDAEQVGNSFQRALFDKATAIGGRAWNLRRVVRGRADVALGHNSYSQIVAARAMRLPTITAMDYEHQPANHLAFRLAHKVLLPEAISDEAVKKFGLRPSRIMRYAGVKEDITLSEFAPTPGFRATLGVPEDVPFIVLRGAPEGAVYHRGDNPLFDDVIARLTQLDAYVLLSPRTRSQADSYRNMDRLNVLDNPVNGGELLFAADLFVGGGGTMTREAAVLGTPTYSVFAGKPAAVDQYLIDRGKLQVLADGAALPTTVARKATTAWTPKPEALDRFVELILEAVAASRR